MAKRDEEDQAPAEEQLLDGVYFQLRSRRQRRVRLEQLRLARPPPPRPEVPRGPQPGDHPSHFTAQGRLLNRPFVNPAREELPHVRDRD